jgi:peptidyl-tRNA hydrolase
MNHKTPSKSTAHIVIQRFSEQEKETIKKAINKTSVRRPMFYHDAIIAFATFLLSEDAQ